MSQIRATSSQIVPWSTLCRADWMRDDLVLTMRGWLYATTARLKPLPDQNPAGAVSGRKTTLPLAMHQFSFVITGGSTRPGSRSILRGPSSFLQSSFSARSSDKRPTKSCSLRPSRSTDGAMSLPSLKALLSLFPFKFLPSPRRRARAPNFLDAGPTNSD